MPAGSQVTNWAVCRIQDDSHIKVNGRPIRIVSNRDPTKLPWKEMVRQANLCSFALWCIQFMSDKSMQGSRCVISDSLWTSLSSCVAASPESLELAQGVDLVIEGTGVFVTRSARSCTSMLLAVDF